jgi:hypothetical protein
MSMGSDWVDEIKHDGYRLRVRREGEGVRLTCSLVFGQAQPSNSATTSSSYWALEAAAVLVGASDGALSLPSAS